MSAATTHYPARTFPRVLALFDVDGTLTIPRGEVTEDMMSFMKELSTHVVVGIVGGMYSRYSVGCSFLIHCDCESRCSLSTRLILVFRLKRIGFAQARGTAWRRNCESFSIQLFTKWFGRLQKWRIVECSNNGKAYR
jgi:hypothetical protein